MSVSEGRELLIRQIAGEMRNGYPTVPHERAVEFILAALDRLGFEVIPASTLEADRRVVEAAEDWASGWAVHPHDSTNGPLFDAVRARRWVSGD